MSIRLMASTSRLTPVVVFALCVLGLGESGAARAAAIHPDRIYVNGEIITLDAEGAVARAVAVLGDTIVAVGNDAEIRALAGPTTVVVDLDGTAMTPGFYAPHDHFPGSGRVAVTSVDLNSPPIGKMTTVDEIVAALGARAARTPRGDWVVGRGYDDTLVEEMRHPTRHDLDRASTEHPIWITHISGHRGVANSLALKLASVTGQTPQPEGGVIRMDPGTGEPNGVFEESGGMVRRLIPPISDEDKWEAFAWAVRDYVEDGVTTNVITGGGRQSVADLQTALAKGILKQRVITMVSRANPGEPSSAELGGFISGFGNERLKLGGIKIVQDGSNQGFTGYFTQPYHTPFKGDPTYRGYPRRSRAALTAMVKELHAAGYQIAIHGNGDAAIDDILHAFREAQEEFPRPDARHRIEHCQMVRMDQLDTINELGITPSFFVGHVYYWGDRHRDIFMGPERAARISPLKSARDRGIRFTVHDDTPVTPVNPLQLVWVSVNRLTMSGKPLGPEERITPEQALRAITIDAAWQNFEENIKGSIEPGKLADLVRLSESPLSVDPARIRDIQVLETIVGGETVFTR